MKTVVVSNPASRRVSRSFPGLAKKLAVFSTTRHQLVTNERELMAAIDQRVIGKGDLLVIHGGDGTAQFVLTRLLRSRAASELPTVALLPAGTANMTAADFNIAGGFRAARKSLCNILAGRKSPVLEERRLLRTLVGSESQYGVFFGSGNIVQGVRYCLDVVHRPGMHNQLGAGVAMLRAVWGIAQGHEPFNVVTRVTIDGSEHFDVHLMLFTTLRRLFLGIQPFWGVGGGSLRMTLLEKNAANVMRQLPSILTAGRRSPDAVRASGLSEDRGYHSRNFEAADLIIDGDFTIDGEIFGTGGGPVRIEQSHPIRILRL